MTLGFYQIYDQRILSASSNSHVEASADGGRGVVVSLVTKIAAAALPQARGEFPVPKCGVGVDESLLSIWRVGRSRPENADVVDLSPRYWKLVERKCWGWLYNPAAVRRGVKRSRHRRLVWDGCAV